MIEIKPLYGQICLGKQGENLARVVCFEDGTTWPTLFGEGRFELLHQRHAETTPYPVIIETENNKVYWKVTKADTAIAGEGKCELHYIVDDVVVKSKTYATTVVTALGEGQESADPQAAWVDRVLRVVDDVQQSAKDIEESAKSIEEMTESINSCIDSGGGENSVILNNVDKNDKDRVNTARGKSALAGGESTKAASDFSRSGGYKTLAGARGYYIWEINPHNKTITLAQTKEEAQSVGSPRAFGVPYLNGDVITIALDYEWINCSIIEDVTHNVITVDSIPTYYSEITKWSTKADRTFVNNTVRCYSRPEVGLVDVGLASSAEGVSSNSFGHSSHTEGLKNNSYGAHSHTEGFETSASYCSHSEGRGTNSYGKYCHAEGRDTIAGAVEGADCAHAEGKYSKALAEDSHAEGYNVEVRAKKAHGEGVNNLTEANAEASHIEGGGNKITSGGMYAHAEGLGNIASSTAQHVQGKYNEVKENAAFIIGGGTSDKERKNIVEVDWSGNADFNGYVKSNGKSLATEEFVENEVKNIDFSNYATKKYVTDEINKIPEVDLTGYATKTDVEKAYVTAGRLKDSIVGIYSTAEGYQTVANRGFAHAEGYQTFAGQEVDEQGNFIGGYTGENAHAEGQQTRATSYATHAEGKLTVANRPYAHSEGYMTLAGYDQSVVDLYGLSITDDGGGRGSYAHTEGQECKALNYGAHAEGIKCIAFGNSSHAGGSNTYAVGTASFAHGLHLWARENYQAVFGQHNADNPTALFIVGNGETETTQSNAFEVISDSEGVAIKVGKSILREEFIAALVDRGLSIKFLPVAELPAEDIDESIIYLLPSDNPEGNNSFDEYVYSNGAWEQIGSSTVEINLDGYVKNTDYGSNSVAGLVKGNSAYGTYINSDTGVISLVCAETSQIDAKTDNYRPIASKHLDYAVKVGVTTNTNELTDEEKATAQAWLGVDSYLKKDGSTSNSAPLVYTNDENTKHYLANANKSYVPYNIPMIYGSASGTNTPGTGYLLTNVPVNSYHCANKKYVDEAIQTALAEIGTAEGGAY